MKHEVTLEAISNLEETTLKILMDEGVGTKLETLMRYFVELEKIVGFGEDELKILLMDTGGNNNLEFIAENFPIDLERLVELSPEDLRTVLKDPNSEEAYEILEPLADERSRFSL